MSQRALLGVDIGTTGVRAALFDGQGRVVAQAAEACPYAAPSPSLAEANAETWWRAAAAAIGRLADKAPLSHVDAIGVTGQAPSAVLLDGDGEPLRSAILWLDVRASAEARAIEASLGPGRAEAIGGNRVHPYYLGPKLAWLRAHQPGILDRAAFVLHPHAFVVFRLTGEAACDLSTAMLSAPLFDARSRTWSGAGASACGVPMRLLPRIAPAHEVIGAVTHGAASETGLREGTPVVVGGGDFAASALGAGVIDEGEACLMLGTAGNLLMPMAAPRFDSRLVNSHHVGCDRWLLLGGTLCGAALEWFRAAFAPEATWETLEDEAAAVGVESLGGLGCLPYFQGERTPVWDEHARGAFFGIDLTHRRGHLYRALLEGVALGFRDCLLVAEEGGATFHEVVAANGAGKSALLRQTLADALGIPLTWRDTAAGAAANQGEGKKEGESVSGATVAGAALLAGIGSGALAGAHIARAWQARDGAGAGASHTSRAPVIRHEPEPRAHDRLCDVFARRRAVYAAVRA